MVSLAVFNTSFSCFIEKRYSRWDRLEYQFMDYPLRQIIMREVRFEVYAAVFSLQSPNFVKFQLNIVKTTVQADELLWSLPKKPWGSSKEKFLVYHLSVPAESEGGEHRGIKYSRVGNAQAILSYISSVTHESCMSRRKTVVHCSGIFLLNIQQA